MGLKSSYSRLARLFKKSRDEWRTKAIARRKENRLLELKVRDLEISRAKWKEKALRAAETQKPTTDRVEKDEEEEQESDGQEEPVAEQARLAPSVTEPQPGADDLPAVAESGESVEVRPRDGGVGHGAPLRQSLRRHPGGELGP